MTPKRKSRTRKLMDEAKALLIIADISTSSEQSHRDDHEALRLIAKVVDRLVNEVERRTKK